MKVSMGFLVHAGLSQLLLLATMNDTHGFGISARAMAFSIQRAGHTSPSDVSLQTKPMIRLQANNHNYSHDNENDEKQVASNFATSKVSTTSSSLPIKWFSQVVVATTLLLGSTFCNYGLPPMMMENNNIVVIPPAHAYASEGGSKIVGTLQGSGIFFKDSLQIERFEGTSLVVGYRWMIKSLQYCTSDTHTHTSFCSLTHILLHFHEPLISFPFPWTINGE